MRSTIVMRCEIFTHQAETLRLLLEFKSNNLLAKQLLTTQNNDGMDPIGKGEG